jgi:hypothetical protein
LINLITGTVLIINQRKLLVMNKKQIHKKTSNTHKTERELRENNNNENLDDAWMDQDDQEVESLLDDKDAIELEEDQADKIVFGMSFNPKDGDLGDESEDNGDLPEMLIQNRYNPTLSTKPTGEDYKDELLEKMRITNENKAGLGYGDNDYDKEE